MNVAQMSPRFYTAYFGALGMARKQTVTLSEVSHHSVRRFCSRRRSAEPSVLVCDKTSAHDHPLLSVFDSQIAGFYFFSRGSEWAESTTENQRIRGIPRLPRSGICASPQVWTVGEGDAGISPSTQTRHVTDEKIVDSLIWAFVGLLRKGALPKGQVTYR